MFENKEIKTFKYSFLKDILNENDFKVFNKFFEKNIDYFEGAYNYISNNSSDHYEYVLYIDEFFEKIEEDCEGLENLQEFKQLCDKIYQIQEENNINRLFLEI